METGLPYSSFRKNSKVDRSFGIINILLELPRPILYTRIEKRVDQMIASGLEEEARALLPFQEKPALKTVGYEEFFAYFKGEISQSEAVSKIKQHSRNYAKRQATWFRKHGGWEVFHPENYKAILDYLRRKIEEAAS